MKVRQANAGELRLLRTSGSSRHPGITGLEASSSGASNLTANVGGLIIRIGFWGQLYYNYNKEPPESYR